MHQFRNSRIAFYFIMNCMLFLACFGAGLSSQESFIVAQKSPIAPQVKTKAGLYNATFETTRGRITVYLPDDMAAGDTISGTVIAEPIESTDRQGINNQRELDGYVVEVGDNRTAVAGRTIRFKMGQ
jgi:hypothetical protein